MKTLITLFLITFLSVSYGQQYFTFGPSSINGRSEFFFQNSPTNIDGNRIPVMWLKGVQSSPGTASWSLFHIGVDTVIFGKMTGSGVAVIGLGVDGKAYRLSKFDLIDTTFFATRSWVMTQVGGGIDLSSYLKKTSYHWDSLPGKPSTFTPSSHTHPISQVIGLQDSLTGKENAFSKNSAFNKAFGTTAGTVAQGNDSRINNGQTAFGWGNHASAGYLTSEVDGSTTNEIELPSQSGQNGKLLSTNGTTTQWVSSASAPGTNNSAAYGTGTVYTLTTTSSKVDFGTTDPSITLPSAGTYLIIANVKIEYVGLLTLLPTSVNFKLRRTNNTAADLSNATTQFNVPAISLTALTQTAGDTDLQPVIYTTTNSNDVIEVWGSIGANVSAGSIQVGETSIVAIRIY